MGESNRSRDDGEGPAKAGKSKRKLIRRRPRVGTSAALIMSLLFALVASFLAAFDSLLMTTEAVTYDAGDTAPMTLRVAQFSDFRSERAVLEGGPIVIARGAEITPQQASLAEEVIASMPAGLPAMGAYMAVFFLLAMLYASQLRRSHRGRLLRTQAVTLLLLLGAAVLIKFGLALTPLSIMIVPVAGAAIVATLVVDVSAGLATGLMASALIGLLVPFDLGALAILAVQSCSSVLFLGERHHKNSHVVLAGLISALASVIAYVVIHYLATGSSALYDLADPFHSTVVAAACGGLFSAVIAILAKPVYQFLLGDITRNKLVELEDLSNPMLKQIAQDSPGTWQHSLAMANMAEIAANAIGANGRLVRVGAYYHDLGKSLQPKYFIENLEHGEPSPHDELTPEVSCDAIFAHVTEGIRVARKRGLPERIIDFMHMHHGDGLLEYFWAKCQESGNPNNLTVEDFRYPGIPPQSRETAILAIVDAVEAASRTLKSSDDQSISSLVQRIVYGKLHLGQLDESGLSMSDLRKISNSLRESIKHQRHGRIEYPWQRQEREARAREEAEKRQTESGQVSAQTAVPRPDAAITTTQRFMNEPRLDSLDVPRPYWRDPRSQRIPLPDLPGERESSREIRPPEVQAAAPEPPARPSETALTVERPPAGPGASEQARTASPTPDQAAASASMPAPVPVKDAVPRVVDAPAPESEPVTSARPAVPHGAEDPPWVTAPRTGQQQAAAPAPAPAPAARKPRAESAIELPLKQAVPADEPEPAPAPEPVATMRPSQVVLAAPAGRPAPTREVTAPLAGHDEPVAPDEPAEPVENPFPRPASSVAADDPSPSATVPLGSLGERLPSPASASPAPEPATPSESVARVLQRARAEFQDPAVETQMGLGPAGADATADATVDAAMDAPLDSSEFDDQPTQVADPVMRTKTLVPDPLATQRRTPPPPPGSRERKHGSTIELMKHREESSKPVSEDDIEDEAEERISPGTLVMGPPPATRPSDGRKTQKQAVSKPVTIRPRKKR